MLFKTEREDLNMMFCYKFIQSMSLWVGRQNQNSVWVRGGCRLRYELWLLFLLQVCSSLPRPLPLLQRLFQSQETGGEDAGSSVDATRPQRRLLLVRLPHDYTTPARSPVPPLPWAQLKQSLFAFTRHIVTIRWNINHEIIKTIHKNIKTSRQENKTSIHTPRLFPISSLQLLLKRFDVRRDIFQKTTL